MKELTGYYLILCGMTIAGCANARVYDLSSPVDRGVLTLSSPVRFELVDDWVLYGSNIQVERDSIAMVVIAENTWPTDQAFYPYETKAAVSDIVVASEMAETRVSMKIYYLDVMEDRLDLNRSHDAMQIVLISGEIVDGRDLFVAAPYSTRAALPLRWVES